MILRAARERPTTALKSVRLRRQRADAGLERQTSRGLTVPSPALEIKTVTGLRPQWALRASRRDPRHIVRWEACHHS